MTTVASANITAEDTFTTAVQLIGNFNLSLRGPTFTSSTVVTVQRSIDNTTWVDVDTYTAPTEEVGFEPELMWYRVGVKTGDFTVSDDINIRIGREDSVR